MAIFSIIIMEIGHADVVRILCEYGADINTGDIYGRTPLHFAALNGNYPEFFFQTQSR